MVLISPTRRLNAHVVSLLSSCKRTAFWMPTGLDGRVESVGPPESIETQGSRSLLGELSSFGFSGTITHGHFATEEMTDTAANTSRMSAPTDAPCASLFRKTQI